jgi:hypothetical protein
MRCISRYAPLSHRGRCRREFRAERYYACGRNKDVSIRAKAEGQECSTFGKSVREDRQPNWQGAGSSIVNNIHMVATESDHEIHPYRPEVVVRIPHPIFSGVQPVALRVHVFTYSAAVIVMRRRACPPGGRPHWAFLQLGCSQNPR